MDKENPNPVLISRYDQNRDDELADYRKWAAKHDRGQMLFRWVPPGAGIRSGRRVERGTGADIIARLEALPSNATWQEVEEASQSSWRVRCNGCSQIKDVTVVVGAKPDYESSTARLCEACVRVALNLFLGEE